MRKFEYVFGLLKRYKQEYGDLDIPVKWTYDGYALGECVHNIRTGTIKMSSEEVEKLNSIGFIWRRKGPYIFLSVDQICDILEEYKKEYGHCNILLNYVTKDGVNLGKRLNAIDKGYRMISKEEKERLDSYSYRIVRKNPRQITTFNEFYELLLQYKDEYGVCNVPRNYITKDGIRLGNLFMNYKYGRTRISWENMKMLEGIGVDFSRKRGKYYSFDEIYDLLVKFKMEHGHCRVSTKYHTPDGVNLGEKVHRIINGKRRTNIEQRARLNELGFDWKR